MWLNSFAIKASLVAVFFLLATAIILMIFGLVDWMPSRSHPIMIGSAVRASLLGSDPGYALIASSFDIITPENEMKFDTIHPESGMYNFTLIDQIMDFAVTHGIKVRGHCLVWGEQLPCWVLSASREALESIMIGHITHVISRMHEKYPGVIVAWDVVNEAFTAHLHNTPPIWSRIGSHSLDYVGIAFAAAAAVVGEGAQLFYNDYDDEGLADNKLYWYISKYVRAGVPIEGVGMQCHFGLRPPSEIRENMMRYAALGLTIHVTELDVSFRRVSGADACVWPRKSPETPYKVVREACETVGACAAIVTWGFTCSHSWLADLGLGVALPYDAELFPTPIRAILRGEN